MTSRITILDTRSEKMFPSLGSASGSASGPVPAVKKIPALSYKKAVAEVAVVEKETEEARIDREVELFLRNQKIAEERARRVAKEQRRLSNIVTHCYDDGPTDHDEEAEPWISSSSSSGRAGAGAEAEEADEETDADKEWNASLANANRRSFW
jgi:hypothetical protein